MPRTDVAVAAPRVTSPARKDLVVPVATALIVGAALLRGWTALRGYFYAEDFAVLASAMDHSFLDPSYLLGHDGTGLWPGAVVSAWLAAHLTPLQWGPGVVMTILVQAATTTAFLALLVRLFGRHPLILPPVAILSLSSLSLPGTLWWSQALGSLPAQLAGVLGLLALVAHLRSGRVRPALLSTAALATALLFSERAVVFVLLAVGILLCWFTTGGVGGRLRQLVTTHRWISLPYAVVLSAYAVGVFSVVSSPFPLVTLPAQEALTYVMDSVFRAVVPALVGGPWQWLPVGTAGALADPNPFVITLSALLVGTVVAVTVWTRERAARAWALLGGGVVVAMAWPVLHGALALGPVVALDLRYQGEVALVAALMLGFATMPLTGTWAAPPLDAPTERAAGMAGLHRTVVQPLRAAGVLGSTSEKWVVPAVALTLLVPSMLASHLAYDPWWTHNPAKPWAQRAIPAVQQIPTGTLLGSTYVPSSVVSGLLYPANQSTRMLAPVLTNTQVLQPGVATNRLVALDDTGTLRLAGVFGSRGTGAPDDGCGWRLGDSVTTITLSAPVTTKDPVLRLGSVAGGTLTLPVTVGDQETELPIQAGLGAVFLQVPTGVESVTFHPSATGATMCSNDLTVGDVVPLPRTTP